MNEQVAGLKPIFSVDSAVGNPGGAIQDIGGVVSLFYEGLRPDFFQRIRSLVVTVLPRNQDRSLDRYTELFSLTFQINDTLEVTVQVKVEENSPGIKLAAGTADSPEKYGERILSRHDEGMYRDPVIHYITAALVRAVALASRELSPPGMSYWEISNLSDLGLERWRQVQVVK